jgi:hypothetical protein
MLLMLALSSVASAQSLTLLREVKMPLPVSVSLDRYNRIYTGDEKGNVLQYDSTGKVLLQYSPPKVARLSLLEAWPTTKVFAFSRDFQQYTLLDRFLTPIGQYVFNEDQVGFARVATLAADGNLWLFDESEFSVKKFDLPSQTITLRAPMNRVLDARDYDINFLREYQNLLLINDRNSGLLVFDNLGNYKKKLPFKGLTYFGLLNDEVYFLQGNEVHYFHLYTFQERALALPKDVQPKQILAFEDKLAVFTADRMQIFRVRKE